MGGEGFEYESASQVTDEIGAQGAELLTPRTTTPPAAADPSMRRTHFRGHRIDEKVRGLRPLPVGNGRGTAEGA